MRAVLDTHVVMSGFLTPGGTPARVLALLDSRRLTAVYSGSILKISGISRAPRAWKQFLPPSCWLGSADRTVGN